MSANDRVGILVSGDARGIILHNEASANGRAGIIVQDGAGAAEPIRVEDNDLAGNTRTGIAISVGANAIILHNEIRGTLPDTVAGPTGSYAMGDGIGLYSGGRAEVSGNRTADNARAGVLADGCDAAGTTISANTIATNAHGLVLQGVTPTVTDNTLTANAAGDAIEAVDPGTFSSSAEVKGGFSLGAPTF